ncbi:ATP synthase mitochondrial F1 complex assembly factor 2 [Elasticomyces elasticus]|nr:ATP synthase mitochondrial F1 complex assembly factor 2 [Elasticomyces elasticus]
MELYIPRAITAASSLSARRSAAALRCLHTTTTRDATPVSHPTVVGPPPSAPQASVAFPQDRVARKRQQAELLERGQQLKTNAAKPTTALQKRFWKNVSVKDTQEGLQILLDSRPVRTASRTALSIPHNKRALAISIAVEWDQLVTAQQALKQHYIPLTSLTSRATDIDDADKKNNSAVRESIVRMALRYLSTDTLLCWAPEKDLYDANRGDDRKPLRHRQREEAEPIIAFLKTHIFPGVEINPILSEDSIMPTPQPDLTREVIRGWVHGLPAFELAALERGTLATKSLLVAARLMVEWSQEFRHLHRDRPASEGKFGIPEAARASTLELLYQIEQWGEVEDTHDVDREDLRRQLGSVVLLNVSIVMAKRKADQAMGTMPTPKKAQRRLKMLSTYLLSTKQQTIYNRNATTSPLLKLPPEIRNRIWGFLFGGKTVHIEAKYVQVTGGGRTSHLRSGVLHTVCQVPNDDEETARQITYHNGLDGTTQCFRTYGTRHRDCHRRGDAKGATLPLAVLRTCRQMHQEAALLPFQLNEFSFSWIVNLAPFLQSLF